MNNTPKSILHVTVKTDEHGNRPTNRELRAIQQKFNRAIRMAGQSYVVIVTDDHVSTKALT